MNEKEHESFVLHSCTHTSTPSVMERRHKDKGEKEEKNICRWPSGSEEDSASGRIGQVIGVAWSFVKGWVWERGVDIILGLIGQAGLTMVRVFSRLGFHRL
ncbi:hypothetical protein PtB15_4B289 [Puccinia triticina]|nr:hypothetical protein PtB15_4B289 [Puccinia triticina]